MSDLACPATLLLARHGHADYEGRTMMVDNGGCLTTEGRAQARALAESLLDRRVALVYASSLARAVQTAEIASCVLGVPVRVRHDLREFGLGDLVRQPLDLGLLAPVFESWRAGRLETGCPGAETGADIIRRMSAVLQDISDQHRGETVLVVSHSGALQLTAPALAPGLGDCWTPERQLSDCATIEMESDADGWRCLSWAGEPLGV